MLYLGLGPDEAYEEFMDNSDDRRPRFTSGDFLEERAAAENDQIHSHQSSIRPLTPESSGTVRPLQPAATSKPHHVEPNEYDDAVEIADRFLATQPVVIDFQGVDAELAKRLMDFASGLCYAAGGSMKKVGTQIYLLTPNDVEVSDEDLKGYES